MAKLLSEALTFTPAEDEKDEDSDDESDEEEAKTSIPEPEAEDAEPSEPHTKYMLLERLLKFIRQEEKPVNAVLAGYFSKLVTLLINRKSKSLIPYIFGHSSDFVDCLLHHVYQKSLSELITKLLNISEETARNASNEEVNVAA